MKRKFVVTVEMPHGVSAADMRNYIREAVQVYKGSLPLDDPMSDLNRGTVKVTYDHRNQNSKTPFKTP